MSTTKESLYSDRQITAWLRGLLTIAYADGHFDPEERDLIASLTQEQLAPQTDLGNLEPIEPEELARTLGGDRETKENFLRTGVMMALANGVYSQAEKEILSAFEQALGLKIEALDSLAATLWNPEAKGERPSSSTPLAQPDGHRDLLQPVRSWLDGMEVHDPRVARFICKMIPSQCPFERDITLFGHKVVHIPPMCKLNPLYEQLVGLRFRSLSFLADECQEDVSDYL